MAVSRQQILERREKVAELLRQGRTHQQISATLGVSPATVFRDIDAGQQELRERTASHRLEFVLDQLNDLQAIKEEAWAAWHKSKQDAESLVESLDAKGKNKRGRPKTKTTKGQCGDSRFLAQYMSAMEREAKLLGLDILPEEKQGTEDGQFQTRQQLVEELKKRLTVIVAAPAAETNGKPLNHSPLPKPEGSNGQQPT